MVRFCAEDFALPVGAITLMGPAARSSSSRVLSLFLGRPGNTSTLPLSLTPAALARSSRWMKFAAALPPSLRLVAPVRSGPWSMTFAPTLPKLGCVSGNRSSPTGRLKSVPSSLLPPQ